jgi:magnesium transporter
VSEDLVNVIGYDPAGAWGHGAGTIEEIRRYRNPAGITWIDVERLDAGMIHELADMFRIHPLTVEDILDTEQRPKTEEFDDYLFITFKAIHQKGEDPVFEQISIVLKEDTVLTFQELPGDNFDGIRKRIRDNAGRIRRLGADYLAYALMDAVVDGYVLVLDSLGDEIETFESRAADSDDAEFIPDIQKTKQKLFTLRKSIWPLRDSVSHIIHSESNALSGELEPFFKDLYDHVLQAAETVENYRELVAGVMEVNLSAVSNGMNRIMKVLTIISTIFIPLTFIAGVYGMNFDRMPELRLPFGYPVIMGLMLLIAAGMLIFFKRRRWI